MAKELEEAVIDMLEKMVSLDDTTLIAYNLNAKELKKLLVRVMNFIDYAKFEFGEDVTNHRDDSAIGGNK